MTPPESQMFTSQHCEFDREIEMFTWTQGAVGTTNHILFETLAMHWMYLQSA
jgi:hypothetical protein